MGADPVPWPAGRFSSLAGRVASASPRPAPREHGSASGWSGGTSPAPTRRRATPVQRSGGGRVHRRPLSPARGPGARRLGAGGISRLDVLVNNVGGSWATRHVTEDGLERTFALNLAPFLLTNLLLDRLRASAPSRVVTVSSGAQAMGRIDFDDLQGERRYNGQRAYNQSKLANVMFTYELARRLEGSGVTANALHPGVVRTAFGQEDATLWMRLLMLRRPALPEEPGAGRRDPSVPRPRLRSWRA